MTSPLRRTSKTMSKIKAELRDNPKAIIGYINGYFDVADADGVFYGLSDAVKAQNVSRLSGGNEARRVDLYRTLRNRCAGRTSLNAIIKIIDLFDFELQVRKAGDFTSELNKALRTDDVDKIAAAFARSVKAFGANKMAKTAPLNRTVIWRLLERGTIPTLATTTKLVTAFGGTLFLRKR